MTINPIIQIDDFHELHYQIRSLRNGEVKVRTKIEMAIQDDLKQELVIGVPTCERYKRETTSWKVFQLYLNLGWEIFFTNQDNFAYLCMLVTAMVNPGVITLVYPFAVFGYAIFEETRPPKWFWHFILFYT